jgi:hypothetical protein
VKNIHKGYDLASIVHSLRQAYFAKNIDNLLVQLLGSTNNKISTFVSFHIILLFFAQYLIPTV